MLGKQRVRTNQWIQQIGRIQNQYKKSGASLYTNKLSEREIKKIILFTII